MKDPVKIARGGEVWGEFQPEHIPEFLKNGSLILTDFFWNETAGEWQPLSKWGGGKLRDRLHGVFAAIVGQKNGTVFIVLVLALLLASWIFPPWVHYNPRASGYPASNPHGWFFIFDTEQGEGSGSNVVMHIDFGRLILLDAIIVVGAVVLAWITARLRFNFSVFAWLRRRLNSKTGRFVLLTTAAVIVLALLAPIGWQQVVESREAARKETAQAAEKAAAQEKLRILAGALTECTGKTGVTQKQLLRGIRKARELGYSDDEIANYLFANSDQCAEAKRVGYTFQSLESSILESQSKVEENDLKKIEVSDWSWWNDYYVQGRITNGLKQEIRNVALKVTIYDEEKVLFDKSDKNADPFAQFDKPTEKIVAVERMVVPSPFFPAEPKMFKQGVSHETSLAEPKKHKTRVEITGAHYAD